jgi:methionine sulfoxide reductase heme-binding subunit
MAARLGDRIVLALGIVLLVGYLVQARLAVEWPWLAGLQANDTYKVISGLVLGAYLYWQWSVASRRQFSPRAVSHHKLGGALAPAVLYMHASRFGYGYLLLLGLCYLGTAMIGLLDAVSRRLRARWVYTLWFVVHVSTATILVMVGGYHVVIALAYE